jgi:putative PIN family toxin of toxin-antitoxin system
MKIVLDTNVLMSALFFGGLAEKLVNLVLLNIIAAVASEEILREYEDTTRDMLQKTQRKDFKFSFVSLIEHLEIIEPQSNIHICRDPDDDKFINCASEACCDFIVIGDKDLLVLNQYKNIKIVTIREFLEINYPA